MRRRTFLITSLCAAIAGCFRTPRPPEDEFITAVDLGVEDSVPVTFMWQHRFDPRIKPCLVLFDGTNDYFNAKDLENYTVVINQKV